MTNEQHVVIPEKGDGKETRGNVANCSEPALTLNDNPHARVAPLILFV